METETTEAPAPNLPAVRTDSVCTYLGNIAGVLSSIVVDINSQIASLNRISQTANQESESNGISQEN